MTKNEVSELAKKCNRSTSWVYVMFKKHQRVLTLDELLILKGERGRKPIYKIKELKK